MNSQEYHSLQEAYMNVYQEVDEETRELDEVRGGGKIDAVSDIPSIGERGSRSAKDAGMLMSPLDRATARENALRKKGNTKQANQIKSRFIDPTKSAISRSILAANNAASAEKRRLMNSQESYNPDLFDVILEHLITEGYADTNENALVIMANMSEEWRESIVEAKADEDLTPLQKIRNRNRSYFKGDEDEPKKTTTRRQELSTNRGVKKERGSKSAFGTMKNIGGPYG